MHEGMHVAHRLDRVAKVNPNPFYPWIPSLFCTLPIDDPLKKVRLFCSRDFSRVPYHRSSARKGANLQLRSLLLLLFPPDACPNIFLFRTSAAPSGKAWLLYCEYLVESASGYRRAFLFLWLKVPNRAERNPESSEELGAESGRL